MQFPVAECFKKYSREDLAAKHLFFGGTEKMILFSDLPQGRGVRQRSSRSFIPFAPNDWERQLELLARRRVPTDFRPKKLAQPGYSKPERSLRVEASMMGHKTIMTWYCRWLAR